jgi:general secretion pathway protein N
MRRRLLSRQILLGVGGVFVAIVAALAVLPARWLMVAIPDSWPVAVVDASGPVWQGSALIALGPAGARTTLPQPLTWRAGWQNGLRLELRHPWLGCTLALRPGLSALGISPCSLQLPAETLATLGAPLNTVKPTGKLQLQWPGLRLPHSGAMPDGPLLSVNWANAGSALARINPLGDYRAVLTGKSDAAQLELSTRRGILELEGAGTLVPGRSFSFKGVARPAADASEQQTAGLQAMLSALGRRSGNETLLQIGR